MGSIAVSWAGVESELKVYIDYLMGWRARVRKDIAHAKLTDLRRRVYVEVIEEARSLAVYDASSFPFERLKDGEYPGFFRLEASAMNMDLKDKHPSVFRERGYMNGMGYFMDLSEIAADLAAEEGKAVVPAGAEQDANLEKKRLRVESFLALSRGFSAVARDMVCVRLDFHRQFHTGGMSLAVTTMEHLEEKGQRGSSSWYGASSRAMRREELKERVKLRANIAAHQKEDGVYGGAPKGQRNEDDGEEDAAGSCSPEVDS